MELNVQTAKMVKYLTNKVIGELRPQDFDEAINWGDLSCRSVKVYMDEDGKTGYQVIIEEASPDCYEFRLCIEKRLERLLDREIEVITEW